MENQLVLYSTIRYCHFLRKEIETYELELEKMSASTISRTPEKKVALKSLLTHGKKEYVSIKGTIEKWLVTAPLNPSLKNEVQLYIDGYDTSELPCTNFYRNIKNEIVLNAIQLYGRL